MNVKVKNRLLDITAALSEIRAELDVMKDKQEEDFEKLSKERQESDAGLKQCDVIYNLGCALSAIEEIIDYIGEAQC